jgi:O-antigen/teichoic acid export membrane protein
MNIGYTQGQAETANSIIALVQKLILIPVGLASAFGLTLVPAITNAYTAKNSQLLNEYITKTFKVLFFVLMPTIILLMVFSKSVFGMLFGWTNAVEGGRVTFWYAPSLMLYSLFIVTAAILQGINKHKFVLFSLFVGVIAKFVLNPMLTMEFKEVGVIMSTNIGFLLSVGLNAWAINKYASFPFGLIAKQIKTILLLSIGMFGFGYILNYLLAHLLQNAEMNQYVKNLIILAIAGGLSGLFFLVVSIKSGLLFELLGDRFRFLKRIKKRSEKRKSIA